MTDEISVGLREFVDDLGVAVRENPAPAALIGMGLLWLFAGGRSPAKAAVDYLGEVSGQASEAARRTGQSIRGPIASAGRSVRDGSAAAAQKASDLASAVGQTALGAIRSRTPIDAQSLAAARSNLAALLQRQPLWLGAIGLAIGAGAAATFGPTTAETEFLGDASASVQARVRDFATAASREAVNRADAVATAVADEVRAQGLTPEALAERAREADRKIERVIGRSADRVRSRVRSAG